MVGCLEAEYLGWLWMYKCLNMNNHGRFIGCNGITNDSININDFIEHTKRHKNIILLIKHFTGYMFGWRPPWIVQKGQRILNNLKLYKKTYQYPSQSLNNDYLNDDNKKYMCKLNKNNVFSDSLLVLTNNDGYYLGNILSGYWYKMGHEIPRLPNLECALKRGSMSIDLFPRSSRLYFAGGFVMGTIYYISQYIILYLYIY